MKNFTEKLEKYAELAVKVGVNIQQGQTLVIKTTLDAAVLVRLIAKKAYEAGANDVFVQWSDDAVDRLRFAMAPEETLQTFSTWYAKEREEFAAKGAAFMSIVSSGPDWLQGIQPARIASFNKAKATAMYPYSRYIQTDKVSWTMIAAPSAAWAATVFPDVPEEKQIGRLWEAIFHATRVNTDNPVEAWKQHIATVQGRANELNEKRYQALVFTSPHTNLTVELPENHIWIGLQSTNEQGTSFISNMPTEEIYTAPLKTGVNGYVSSTMPLSYGGNIIDRFTLTFDKGRIVDVKAEEGEEILQNLIATDEGSHYLGEVALVPFDSPIAQSKVLFYHTLFDENASSHLAIGSPYPICIEGGKNMPAEELVAAGLNESVAHVDFMIGSADMDIDGIRADGTREPIFRKGNWA